MSASLKVLLRCDRYIVETGKQCDEETEGELSLRRIDLEDLMSSVSPPNGWVLRYEPDYSAPGEYRAYCPRHN